MKRIFGLRKRPSAGNAVPPIMLPVRSLKRRMSSLGTNVSVGRRLPPRANRELAVAAALEVDVEHAFDRMVFSTGGAGEWRCRQVRGHWHRFRGQGLRTRCRVRTTAVVSAEADRGFLFHTD
jgi:hypothetical protein